MHLLTQTDMYDLLVSLLRPHTTTTDTATMYKHHWIPASPFAAAARATLVLGQQAYAPPPTDFSMLHGVVFTRGAPAETVV
jgi:hypothetical protein